MKKKYYFIGLFVAMMTLVFTTVNLVSANDQNQQEQEINSLSTNLKAQEEELVPNIIVELSSVMPTRGSNGEEIEVIYTVTPQDFNAVATETGSDKKDIILLFDTSNSIDYWRFKRITEGVRDKITNTFANNEKSTLFNVITYDSNVNFYDLTTNPSDKAYQDYVKQNIESLTNTTNNERKLGEALEKAINYLDTNGRVDASKYIIILSGDSATDIDKYQFNLQPYSIFTLGVGNIDSVREMHEKLGLNNNNFYHTSDDNFIVNRMEDISNRIKGDKVLSTISITSELNFDIGEDFVSIEGLTQKQGTLYQVSIPSIKYTPTIKNDDGTYTYESNQKQIKVSFKIQVNTDKLGDVTFSNKGDVKFNNFTYTNLNDEEIKMLIKTPTVEVIEEVDLPKYSNETIKILEIEPADYFRLGSSVGLSTGTEEIPVGEATVEITRITMPEFIGSVEKLNGKYDVIVIGRLVNTSWGKDSNHQKKYQDYSFTRNDTVEENDITNRKAQEIIEFINSGQLVYLDRDILKEDIKDTKLYRNFEDISGTNLIKDKSINELSINEILKYYTESILPQQKQLNLEVIDATPSDITTDVSDSADGIAANRTRKMIISANSLNSLTDNSQISEDVSITLYLDLDGDGLFSDDEVAVSREGLKTPLDKVVLNYNIHPDFLGLLTWKLEVTKGDSNNPIKTYLTGDMNFHRLPHRPKKNINVLQIIPQADYKSADTTGNINNNGEYKILDLSKNAAFDALLKSVALKDYQIDVTTISVTEYNQIVEKTTEISNFEMGIKELNGYYDMLILGFGDCYTGCTPKFGINDAGVQNIYDFVKTGQGLMLTHDTLFYEREKNIESSLNRMLNLFRGISGQARYGLGTSIETETNKIYGALKDLDGSDIPYDPDKPSINELSKYSGSASVWQDSGSMGRLTVSPMVYETNTALITEYPFNLITTGNTLGIRKTHAQYLQLNLEDESVVPWYTLFGSTDSRVNPYDVRNNYYTYSRNNITFSGTGENRREFAPYPDLEMKLFINTIVKAERGANHAPTLELVNISENTTISKHQEKLTFDVIPYDMDLDKMKLSVQILGCKDNICSDTPFLKQIDSDFIRSNGVSANVEFNIKNQLANFDQIKVKVVAIDEHNASSQVTELVINLTNQALPDVSFIADQEGYLIGDDASVTITIKANGDAAKEGQFSLITPLSSFINGVGKTTFNFNIGSNETISEKFYFKVNNNSAIQTDNNTTINVAANYSYCLEIDSTSCVRLPKTPDIKTAILNVKRGQVIVEFSSNVSNLFIDNEIVVQLLDSNREVLKTQSVTNSNNVIFDAVPSGKYFVKILKPDNLSEDNYILQSAEGSLESPDWGKEYGFTLSYNENVKTFHAEINELRFELIHGILKSQTDTDIVIEPSIDQTNPKQVTGNTLVNFAATYTTKQWNNNALLTVSDKLQGFSEKSIQVYRIETDSSSRILSIRPFIGAVVTKEDQAYRITLPEDTDSDVKVLIHYTGLVANENIDMIANRIAVGVTDMNVFIRVNQEVIPNPEPNSYLPNLF